MAKEQEVDQVRGEGEPRGDGGRPEADRSLPWGGSSEAIGPGSTLDGGQETRGGAAYPPRRAPGASFPGVGRRTVPTGKVARRRSRPGMEEALKARNGDPLKAELDNAMKRLGELSMENELLWARARCPALKPEGGRRKAIRNGQEDET